MTCLPTFVIYNIVIFVYLTDCFLRNNWYCFNMKLKQTKLASNNKCHGNFNIDKARWFYKNIFHSSVYNYAGYSNIKSKIFSFNIAFKYMNFKFLLWQRNLSRELLVVSLTKINILMYLSSTLLFTNTSLIYW